MSKEVGSQGPDQMGVGGADGSLTPGALQLCGAMGDH